MVRFLGDRADLLIVYTVVMVELSYLVAVRQLLDV